MTIFDNYLENRRLIMAQGQGIEAIEEIKTDRDHWKQRAEKAERELAELRRPNVREVMAYECGFEAGKREAKNV